MTSNTPQPPDRSPEPDQPTVDVEDLQLRLRRKQGSWVEWGQACAQLQKAGYSTQAIFEATGFEPIQQNQVIVGAQVYTTLLNPEVSEEVRSHFQRKGSDILYELRILSHSERATAAEFIFSRNLDADGAREVAKAIKEFSRRSTLPSGFSNHPGDAVAYQYWRLAKQHADLQERSRWIARGLMFAHSPEARQQIEQLLTDFHGTSTRSAPNFPFYRLEADEEQPCIIPVAGQLPLTLADLKEVPPVKATGLFHLVKHSGNQAWVTLPGWKVVLKAEDPVAILCHTSQLGEQVPGKPEDVLVLIDRSLTEWNDNNYFLVEQAGQLQFQWFTEAPDLPLLGQVLLVLRPKGILDEDFTKDLYQFDE